MRRMSKDPPKTKRKYHYVHFFGSFDNDWVAETRIYDYMEKVDQCSRENFQDLCLNQCIDLIHEEYWNLIKTKRDPESGYQLNEKEAALIKKEKIDALYEMLCCQSEKRKLMTGSVTEGNASKKFKQADGLAVPIAGLSGKSSRRSRKLSSSVEDFFLVPLPDQNRRITRSMTKKIAIEKQVPSRCMRCKSRFGFLGVGLNTELLIARLLATGHTVNIWSGDGSTLRKMAEQGANRKSRPAEIICESDIIFFTAHDDFISPLIFYAKDSFFDGCKQTRGRKKIFVEIAGIDRLDTVEEFKKLVEYQGGMYMRVKSLIPQVDTNLHPIYMCAGDLEVYKILQVCFSHVTQQHSYVGPFFKRTIPLRITEFLLVELKVLAKLESRIREFPVLDEMGIDVDEYKKVEAAVKKTEEGRKELLKKITYGCDTLPWKKLPGPISKCA